MAKPSDTACRLGAEPASAALDLADGGFGHTHARRVQPAHRLPQIAWQVLSRDQLLAATRVHDDEVYDRSVDVQILRLRRKLEGEPPARPNSSRPSGAQATSLPLPCRSSDGSRRTAATRARAVLCCRSGFARALLANSSPGLFGCLHIAGFVLVVGREAFVLRLISDSLESSGQSAPAGIPAAEDALLDAYSRTIIDVAEHAGPAVVGIRRHGRDHDPDNPFSHVLGSGSG